MIVKQVAIKNKDLKTFNLAELSLGNPQIGLMFSSVDGFENGEFVKRLQSSNTGTQWVGCSTSGEISQNGVSDNSTILTTIKFDNPNSRFRIASATVDGVSGSLTAGQSIAKELLEPDLKSVILFSPGVGINGSFLVQGASEVLGTKVTLVGGLAGDGGKFQNTLTLSPKGVFSNQVVAVGLYGNSLALQSGCMGGWEPFGKTRTVTKSVDNILYELDGAPALDIYKEYLGDYAKDLPASGLMFPFTLLKENQESVGLIRTILGINEADGSLTLAGNIDQNSKVRLMNSTTKGLVMGSKVAGQQAISAGQGSNSLVIAISCVGRKIVMGPNIDEEIETLTDMFGGNCVITGFYSYGEIAPSIGFSGCHLHNQTMTLSYIYEH